MRNRLAQITLALIIVVALPIALFFVRSLRELSENEKMVRKVFEKQLQSILYSLNQHTETLLGLWSTRLDLAFELGDPKGREIIEELMWKNPSILSVAFYDLADSVFHESYGKLDHPVVQTVMPNRSMVLKLFEFREHGYQKVASTGNADGSLLYFLLSGTNTKKLCCIWIDPGLFVQRNLSPVMQQASQELFLINARRIEAETTQMVSDTVQTNDDLLLTQASWYLPGYGFEIGLRSKTIDEMVAERTKKNYILLLVTLFIVAIGGGFVIFSIRREMHLAAMKAEFVSNVSHELRTPLALIRMYSETLIEKRLKDKSREEEYLRVIDVEAQRLSDMVARILNFSKMERGKREYRFVNCDMVQLVETALSLFEPRFEKEKVTINWEPHRNPVFLFADREAIIESLVNLIDNALNYSRDEGKTISIKIQAAQKQTTVEVADNGIGIAPKDQKKIFGKFYRVTKGDLANKVKGSGLGLNIVQQIMKIHKGKITVRSRLGEGSTFTLHFPLGEQQDHC